MSQPAIWTENLGKFFGQVRAMHGVNLSVPAGSIYGLLGPNGAGKTTTIKILVNLLTASHGHAEVLGRNTAALDWRDFQKIAYVSENQALPEKMRVGELLDYLAPFYPTWDAALRIDLQRQLELPAERRLKHLSRGMKMKAALLASLAFRPELILLDEPFSGLDPVVREDFSRSLLGSFSGTGRTVFLSSHDVDEVERMCDWVGIMAPGRLVISERTDELVRRFQSVRVTFPAAFPGPIDWGGDVLRVEQSAAGAQFVHQRFVGEPTLAAIRALAPPGSVVETSPMTLREIYVAVARTNKASR